MKQTDRERFEALIAAKRKKTGGGPAGHDERRADTRDTPKSSKPFRRKV
jgi:hypothetical protein